MIAAEQKAEKLFGLRDSRDMLEKLQWELNNLFWRQRHDIAVCQYHSFNCAVTAWHITDWLWRDLEAKPEVLTKIRQDVGKPLACRKEFQTYVSSECPALDLCRKVGNGSKHCKFAKGIAAAISTGEGDDYGNPIVVIDETHHSASTVFYEALLWYQSFVSKWDVFPEEPFISMGDPDGHGGFPLKRRL